MKNVKKAFDDSLRPEYRRSDFGEMIKGKYATTQVDFAELTHLLVTCIGEEQGLSFLHHSLGNSLAGHKRGDWTYELDNANQITLRYWLTEFRSVAEHMSNQPAITTPEERVDLQNLIATHVGILKTRVDALS